ncbi:MAG: hypothetical protein AB7T74_05490 [Clostridia bacterium]
MNMNIRQPGKLSYKKLLIMSVIVILLIVFANIDNNRTRGDEYPLFAMPLVTLEDGGTEYFLGVGYGVIAWRQIAKGTENGVSVDGYNVGKEFVPFPECYRILLTNDYVPGVDLNFIAVK